MTGYGKLVLAEFDYDKNPAETFPLIDTIEGATEHVPAQALRPARALLARHAPRPRLNPTRHCSERNVYFAQYYLECLSQASYLIADETTGQAVVVDPRRDVAEYLDDARAHG